MKSDIGAIKNDISMLDSEKGLYPNAETSQAIVKIDRYVIFKNETAKLQFTLWE